MAGSFSNKKVARVARTGGGRRRSTSTPYVWYAVLVVICVLGTSLVVFSRNERLDASTPGSTPPLAPSEERPGDRWFEAYGVYLCDKFAPNINPGNDPYGITTQNDGVIYIHPFQKKYAGRNSTLGLFAKGVDMKLDRDSVQVPGDATEYGPNQKCGDKAAELVIREWDKAADESTGEIIKSNPKELLLKDDAAVTIAFVPTDFDKEKIPLPPSAATLPQVKANDAAAAAAAQSEGAPPTGEEGLPAGAEGQTSVTIPPGAEPAPTTAAPAPPP